MTTLHKAHCTLEDTVTDIQCRSMRENLLFIGVAEYRGEHRENCSTFIDDFCEVGESIERAHRIGEMSGQSDHPCSIVVKFSSCRMLEKVREQSQKLAGTRYRIQEQFPKKIQEKRKKLYPILKEAR